MRRPTLLLLAVVAVLLGALAAAAGIWRGGLVQTTLEDFAQPGTQAGDTLAPFEHSQYCAACHGYYDQHTEPYERWSTSLMAQASRDPVFLAALAIAEQDADFAGDLCWRCHAPNGWLAGRANPTDGSALDESKGDLDGVSCHVCHRLVDPVFRGENPPEDQGILSGLVDPPVHEVGSGQYVIDPDDRRRGPFVLRDFFLHEWRRSPFHREALLCATCHDVSNPIFELQSDGTYALGTLDLRHPTQDKHDQFPIERTFSEWKASDYARAEIESEGRFGGRKSAVATCQDCHMPDTEGSACIPGLGETREDLPRHDLSGANSWVLSAVRRMHPDQETGLSGPSVQRALKRNRSMLRRAGDLTAFVRHGELVARVVNQTGHKLPTGYGEGRRMWLHVRFLDAAGGLVGEHGHYDEGSATLSLDTRVYEVLHGIGDDVAATTGLPTGPSFHFALNSVIEKDNRIPPRGFAAEVFARLGAPVVAHHYPDEHYWDDATFPLPPGAVRAEVALLHQTSSREYMEFLRDENTTTDDGQRAHDMWVAFGRSAPVPMAALSLDLEAAPCPAPLSYGLAVRAGGGAPPTLAWSGVPRPGGGFSLHVAGGSPGARAALLVGDLAQRRPLPNGGWRLVGGNVTVAASVLLDGAGAAVVPIAVPPGQAGVARYFQVMFRDPAAPAGVGATPGVFVELCD